MRKLALLVTLLPSLVLAQAFRVGKGIQLVPTASAPTKASSNSLLWVDSGASNAIKYVKPDGSSITLGAGGAGSTLAAAYSAGSSQSDSTIGLDSTRLGIRIRDNATPIAGALWAVQDSAGTTTYLSVSASQTTAGVKIAPSVDASTNLGDSTHHWNVAYATQVVSSSTTLALSGSGAVTTLSDFRPSSDAVRALGNSSYRWLSMYQGNDSVGTTVGTAGLTVENATAATVGAQKYSPAIVWSGNGWKTNATAASQSVRVAAQLVPIQGAANPSQQLVFYESINGGGYAQTEINGYGYFGSNDQSALGTATTSSTTFVDVGDGASTGFASWTAPTTKVTKTYIMRVTVRCYVPTVGSTGTVAFQVLQDGVAIASQPTEIARISASSSSQYLSTSWSIAVPQTAGTAHVYKLQWKVGNASDQAGVTTGVGQLQMWIEG